METLSNSKVKKVFARFCVHPIHIIKTLLKLSILPILAFTTNISADEIYQKSFFAYEASGQLSASAENKLGETFHRYKIFQLDVSAIERFAKKDGGFFTADINFEGAPQWQLNIMLDDIRSAHYSMRESTLNGIITHPREPAFTYRGYNGDNTVDLVYLSILSNYLSGFVQENGEYHFIEPLNGFDKNASDQLYVIYKSEDVKSDSGIKCGVSEANETIERIENQSNNDILACATVEIAIAATNDYVVKNGGATSTQTKIISTLNVVNGLYGQAAIDIKYKLVQVYFAKSNEITSDSETNIYNCINNFRSWGNGGGFSITYDVATLWVGRDLNYNGSSIVGLAFYGICNTSKYNCIEEKNNNISFYGRVQAHELGHNFSCGHQNGNSNNIMNATTVVSSSIWTATDISIISGKKNGSNCFSACSVIGIDDKISNDNISVFPNPASETINVKLPYITAFEITIYNLTGEVIYRNQVNTQKDMLDINISTFGSGIYLLKMQIERNIYSKKIIVLQEIK